MMKASKPDSITLDPKSSKKVFVLCRKPSDAWNCQIACLTPIIQDIRQDKVTA